MKGIELEQAVIGGLLLEPNSIDRCGDLKPAHFSDNRHRKIFAGIQKLVADGSGIDIHTVFEAVATKTDDDLYPYLNSLLQNVPSAANVGRYAQSVKDYATARGLLSAASEIQAIAGAVGVPVADKLAQSQSLLDKLTQNVIRQDPVAWAESYGQYVSVLESRLDKKARAIATGISVIDDALNGGLRPGHFALLGARPRMGKTTLAQNIAAHISIDYSVLFCSMEMPTADFNDRFTAVLGGVKLDDVLRPPADDDSFWSGVTTAAHKIQERNLFIDDQSALSLIDVRLKSMAVKRRAGLHVLIIDHLQLMENPDRKKDGRHFQLEEVSRGLKALAKDLGIAVLALVQVSREVESRADGMANLSDIKDCGQIEQDADIAMFLDRPIVRKPDSGYDWNNYARLLIAKNRQGKQGVFPIHFDGSRQRFTDWDGPEPTTATATYARKGLR